MFKDKFLWKKEWYSICSIHRDYDKNCELCKTGSWHNIIITKISSFIYNKYPKMWVLLKNKLFLNKINKKRLIT